MDASPLKAALSHFADEVGHLANATNVRFCDITLQVRTHAGALRMRALTEGEVFYREDLDLAELIRLSEPAQQPEECE